MLIKMIILCGLMLTFSCSDRDKVNPFDSSGDISLSLGIVSYEKNIELTWDRPQVDGFSGFNVYRKAEGYDKSFVRIARDLPPGSRKYIDNDIEYERTYIYYITISGYDIESRPSEKVSINPGPGFNWIVDKWGYQIIKTTYDLEHKILFYDTDWPPTNMALSKDLGVGVILYLGFNTVDKINLNGERTGQYTQIEFPIDIVYDHVDSLFWIVDSSGILYSLNTKTDRIVKVSQDFIKPTALFIAPEKDLICVVDKGSKAIIQLNRMGNIVNTISAINGKKLTEPTRFVIDEINDRTWLIDRNYEFDYIYTKGTNENDYTLLDSVFYSGDLETNSFDETGWLISYNAQNSAILQLSATGSRQLELFGYYNPNDILINPFDGTLLVADSGHSLVIHYDRDNNILGSTHNLTFPVKVLIE